MAPATRFVSHAWANPFADLLAALEAQAARADTPNEYYWLDGFVVNQHAALSAPLTWWTAAFRNAVSDIRHTLVVLQPWRKPLPLGRSWCLWELFCSHQGGGVLEMILPPKVADEFQLSLLSECHDLDAAMRGCVDTRHAAAYHSKDAEMIAAAVVESPGGFDAVDQAVITALHDWLSLELERLLGQLEHGTGRSFRLRFLIEAQANTLVERGTPAALRQAEPLLWALLRTMGPGWRGTTATLALLADVLTRLGATPGSEPFLALLAARDVEQNPIEGRLWSLIRSRFRNLCAAVAVQEETWKNGRRMGDDDEVRENLLAATTHGNIDALSQMLSNAAVTEMMHKVRSDACCRASTLVCSRCCVCQPACGQAMR